MSAPTQAVAYLRVSSIGQIEGDGLTRQREAVAEYAKRNGIAIVGEYRDEGVSGATDHADRPGFSDLLSRIAGNCVRVVLVERADRLARDLMVQETMLDALRRLGVKVIDASAGTDLNDASDPSRVLIRQVMGAVAQWDKNCLVAKLRKARSRVRATKGRCEGRKPYGCRAGEQAALARMSEMAADRVSLRRIAEALNAEGHKTRQGKPWSFGTVSRIIKRAAKAA